MRKPLIILCFFLISKISNSQVIPSTKVPVNIYNKYLIKIDSNVVTNNQIILPYIKQICAAYAVNFNSQTSRFEVYTTKTLEQNIVSGKLQKNATPLSSFIYEGKIGYTTGVISNTVNAQ